jgi:hypothetical protein
MPELKLSLIDKLKLLTKLNSTVNEVEKGISVKDSTKIILAIIGLFTTIVQIPSIQAYLLTMISTHPAIASILAGLAAILGILHIPVKNTMAVLMVAIMLGFGMTAKAQTATDIYAGGLSYSVNARPSIAGTGLYAHPVADTTYAYTSIDVVPNTVKPFTVTSNIAVGIGQKVATLGKLPIYCTTGAGPSWTGTNVGWAYNFGCLTEVVIKNQKFMPTFRALKSSVSNGTGYQPVIGILYRF